jgi:hypothetical protein
MPWASVPVRFGSRRMLVSEAAWYKLLGRSIRRVVSLGCWTRPAGRAHILLRSLRWAPGLRWQRDKKKVSSNRHNDNGPTASPARVAPKCSRRPRVHIVMAVAQVTCCSMPSVESLAMQYSWTSRNSIGVRMDSTDLAVDGGEFQVRNG